MISKDLISSLQAARRPLFIWGAGMRRYRGPALALARNLGIPVACTWGAIDLMHHDDPLMAGGFGTHGTRAANFAVQNSDLIISIGSRLDTKATGFPAHFARGASLAMVDIDHAEIEKFKKLGRKIDFPICADAGEFIRELSAIDLSGFNADWFVWQVKIMEWRSRYDTPTVTWAGINPYQLMKDIAKWTTPQDIICSDTGTALGYVMQGFPFKGERFLHAFNMTPMGYGLPAAIGASLSSGKRVILVTGDGSIMMSLAELATISRWDLPIKIILLNNHQHAMCVQTEHQWFGGRHAATTPESGLGFPPSFDDVARSFAIPCRQSLKGLFDLEGPAFHTVDISRDAKLIPQARFGFPIEDQEPSLSREELCQQMIVPLCSISEQISTSKPTEQVQRSTSTSQ